MDDKLAEIYHTPISELHNLPIKEQALWRLRNLYKTEGGWLNYKLRELARKNFTEDAVLKIQETAAKNIATSLLNLTGDVDWNVADEMWEGWVEDQVMEKKYAEHTG